MGIAILHLDAKFEGSILNLSKVIDKRRFSAPKCKQIGFHGNLKNWKIGNWGGHEKWRG